MTDVQLGEFRSWLTEQIDAIGAKLRAAKKTKIPTPLVLSIQERKTLLSVRDELDRRFGGEL
jgi:hypothetical protein